jgi:predicted TIM-barrel fold metal-dependent hydrolase
LARLHKEFLPAVSIHPARPDALEELERCVQEGAVMMKCLPNCQMIDCSDRRFIKFWERMAAAGLPLLAHTGGEHTLQVLRPDLADPRILELPIECGVNVIAAHSGSKSGVSDPEYFEAFAEMALKHERFYGDNSAFNIPIRSRVIPKCVSGALSEKILHGSDYPVPIYGHWAWMRGLINFRTLRQCQALPNVLERDYQLKRAMGFAPQTFTRIEELLPKAALAKLDRAPAVP